MAEEVEAWIGQTSQILLFLAGSLTTPTGFFGVFFGYPSRTRLRTQLGPQSLCPFVILLLPPLLEEWVREMVLLLKRWQQEVVR